MTIKIFLILPHQLFESKHVRKWKKSHHFVIYEHSQYFRAYTYNYKRLLMHRGSMKCYYDYLKSKGHSVFYVETGFWNEDMCKILKKIGSKGDMDLCQVDYFDPIDKIKVFKDIPNAKIVTSFMHESPNFLLNKEIYAKYRLKTDKFFFNAFYMWSKKQIGMLPNVKSQDKDNRKGMNKSTKLKIPPLPSNSDDSKYIKEATEYVRQNFRGRFGTTDNFIFPLTHKTAKKWLKYFVKKKLDKFGEYQDAIDKDDSYLFHSLLSTSINIGLLNPDEVASEVLKYKDVAPLNSVEGFIRQLFWREYQRYCYIYCDFDKQNYFGNRKMLGTEWYNGTTGVLPVDNCIKKAFETGYLHHIERLMVIGNYMNLSGIKPKDGFKWFMEFSCDSYEWVMCQNVYDMVFFVTGGVTMRRPYISSSNYILKMSNYSGGKEATMWTDKWDELYDDFIKRNRKKLWKFRYYFRSLT